MYDIIIVGAGPAGLAAAVYCARKILKTLVVSKDVGGQAAWSSDVENYLGYEFITGVELVQKFREHVENFDLDLEEGVAINAVGKKKGNFFVASDDGREFTGRCLLIASGKEPRQLGVTGEEEYLRKGVTYCATCDAPLFRGKDVVVIGGGNSAMDAAIQLANIAKQVTILVLKDRLDCDAVMEQQARKFKNVRIIMNAQTTAVRGEVFVNGISYMDTVSGEEHDLPVEGVFIEVGQLPSTGWLGDFVKKNVWDEVVIDANNHTNVEGVFAAGDVSSVSEKQIIVAAGEGAKAALVAYTWLLTNQKIQAKAVSKY